jgi:pimeloyl-ACP methyl ester carboxylesterase
VPQDWAEKAAALLPRGKLQVIPRAAHTMNFSMPKEFAGAVKRFLGLS